ncbi:hypothetical protein AOL_s00043g165 [Orbilia oligospora ATCC 24927]|uniref:Uncharacterized protein n=1 Tax=Arthrobotrys oligospora (strain ATCC 24927 / CBS 115.81 / DSM 1491) TaxID=756982 RepID=G1X392_ARTOA|nr:hypothetical protein AOL_s00043g165 [Orbilia oligospora ATCC 24927]EGX52376.1 hypothetical protein AOL_s00043g165 [Orbilia oligospora ATCC 24927]
MAEKEDYTFQIQLNTEVQEIGFHSKNDGDEIQRPDIVDDICRGLLIQARIDRIIHGTETENGSPATLVVFGFRFHGLGKRRRLQSATIEILFQDLGRRRGCDPEVISLWPNGEFTLSETAVSIQNIQSAETGIGIEAMGATGTMAVKLEQQESYETSDKSIVVGSIILDKQVRNYGPKNAIRLTLEENKTNKTGVITDLRSVVLLKRHHNDIFEAFVKVKATGSFSYNAVRGLRNLVRMSPDNDPVRFEPGKQYLRTASLADPMEARLGADIDSQNLSKVRLDKLGAVLGTTVVTTIIDMTDSMD